ncbi:MAG TPA: UDP-N-acetylmuramate--L-alanine ligase [Salinivirgaceae bacterium]|nr:UDP-N-acetylmuramate--L-alanine ligase [Salinivirgaceae bacterium]
MIQNSNHIKNIFCIGIGGIGMSALARYWKHAGKNVAGYDLRETKLTRKLESEAIKVFYSDDTELIPSQFLTGETLVVRTPAVPDTLSVLKIWSDYGKTVMRRSQMLALIASNHKVYAVSGTHGKTSITTLLSHLLNQREQGVNAFMGGISRNYGTNILLSNSVEMVVEADEYDRAFLQLNPHAAIITSVEADHLDIYQNLENLKSAFNQFAEQVSQEGFIICKRGIALKPNKNTELLTYHAEDDTADIFANNIKIVDGCYQFDLVTPFGKFNSLQIGAPGYYNFENAVAASSFAIKVGLNEDLLRTGLLSFKGVERRFEMHNKSPEIYIDDYAHHPGEIDACIKSVRTIFPDRKITVIFQPHLYSRTRDLESEFITSLSSSDLTIITDIYPAREQPIEGITGQALASKVKNGKYVAFDDIISFVKNQRFDILVTMGAGSIGDKALQIKDILNDRV